MDNIDEIEPDVVFFSAEDFPRHWKPFLKLLRASFNKDRTTFVLLKGDLFPFEEAAKAKHLEVTGIIRENLEDRKEYSRLEELLSHYTSLKEIRSENRYIPETSDKVEFIFTHPEDNSIITGSIFDLSPTGTAFEPDEPDKTKKIAMGTVIPRCSLKVEKDYLTFSSTVIRNEGRLALQFVEIDDDVIGIISDFIERRAERELSGVLQNEAAEA